MMGKILVIFSIIFSVSAFSAPTKTEKVQKALEGISFCQNFVRADETHVYLGYGYYSNSEGGFHQAKRTPLVVASLENSEDKRILDIQDSAIDLISLGDRLYILTYTALEEWDKKSWTRVATYSTYLNNSNAGFEEHATQMALYKNKLIISQGRLGYSIFDLNAKAVTHQQKFFQELLPLESKATGVAVIGDKAYFALDSFTLVPETDPKKPFQGVVVVDLATNKITDRLAGLEGGSDALFAYDSKLVISMYGIPLLKYDASKLQGARLPGPTHRISKFPEDGRLLGKPTLEGEHIYTCFSTYPDSGPVQKVPRVWVRKDLRIAD